MAAADALAKLMRVLQSVPEGLLTAAVDVVEDDPEPSSQGAGIAAMVDHADRLLSLGVPTSAGDVAQIIRLAQHIDAWYAPLNQRGLKKTFDHIIDLNRLATEGRLNEDAVLGSVVPREAEWRKLLNPRDLISADAPKTCCRSPELTSQLLDHLIVLPIDLPADCPDGSVAEGRRVNLRFRRVPALSWRKLLAESEFRIGFAPLLEAPRDVSLAMSRHDGRAWYDIDPANLRDRIADVFQKMANDGAQIVVFPETSVPADHLDVLRDAIRATAGSSIELVFAGVLTPPATLGGRSRNHIVILDRRGHQLHTHDKLMRWNLNGETRQRYGFDQDMETDETLYENIEPGDLIDVVELPGLGRFTMLICADMNARHPWEWVRQNLLLDWTIAPILDSSMGIHRWIGRDAERAARVGRSRVIVTNSFALQAQYAGHNKIAQRDSVVALFMDGRDGPITFQEHATDIQAVNVARVAPWDRENWSELPPPDDPFWGDGGHARSACATCPEFNRPYR